MKSISNKKAREVAGNPFIQFAVTRELADGVTIPVVDTDWTDENLKCSVSLTVGGNEIEQLPVNVTSETRTWQEIIDYEGVRLDQLPYDGLVTDTVNITLVSISWTNNEFTNIPINVLQAGKPVVSYFEIRRVDDTGGAFIVGELILIERIQ